MKEIYEQLLALLLLDMLHSDLLKEGYAINGSGVAIDMEEIKKAEDMYDNERNK